jgi:hypothetical protein
MSFVGFPNFKPAVQKLIQFIAGSCCLDGEIKFIPAINEHQSQLGVLNYRELVWKVFVLQGNTLLLCFRILQMDVLKLISNLTLAFLEMELMCHSKWKNVAQ